MMCQEQTAELEQEVTLPTQHWMEVLSQHRGPSMEWMMRRLVASRPEQASSRQDESSHQKQASPRQEQTSPHQEQTSTSSHQKKAAPRRQGEPAQDIDGSAAGAGAPQEAGEALGGPAPVPAEPGGAGEPAGPAGEPTQSAVTPRSRRGPVTVTGRARRCAVCRDASRGYHFGAFTCEGCKSFFLRTINRSAKPVCQEEGNCNIHLDNRKSCKGCRYQQCLRAGMSRANIRFGRHPASFVTNVAEESEDDEQQPQQQRHQQDEIPLERRTPSPPRASGLALEPTTYPPPGVVRREPQQQQQQQEEQQQQQGQQQQQHHSLTDLEENLRGAVAQGRGAVQSELAIRQAVPREQSHPYRRPPNTPISGTPALPALALIEAFVQRRAGDLQRGPPGPQAASPEVNATSQPPVSGVMASPGVHTPLLPPGPLLQLESCMSLQRQQLQQHWLTMLSMWWLASVSTLGVPWGLPPARHLSQPATSVAGREEGRQPEEQEGLEAELARAQEVSARVTAGRLEEEGEEQEVEVEEREDGGDQERDTEEEEEEMYGKELHEEDEMDPERAAEQPCCSCGGPAEDCFCDRPLDLSVQGSHDSSDLSVHESPNSGDLMAQRSPDSGYHEPLDLSATKEPLNLSMR